MSYSHLLHQFLEDLCVLSDDIQQSLFPVDGSYILSGLQALVFDRVDSGF